MRAASGEEGRNALRQGCLGRRSGPGTLTFPRSSLLRAPTLVRPWFLVFDSSKLLAQRQQGGTVSSSEGAAFSRAPGRDGSGLSGPGEPPRERTGRVRRMAALPPSPFPQLATLQPVAKPSGERATCRPGALRAACPPRRAAMEALAAAAGPGPSSARAHVARTGPSRSRRASRSAPAPAPALGDRARLEGVAVLAVQLGRAVAGSGEEPEGLFGGADEAEVDAAMDRVVQLLHGDRGARPFRPPPPPPPFPSGFRLAPRCGPAPRRGAGTDPGGPAPSRRRRGGRAAGRAPAQSAGNPAAEVPGPPGRGARRAEAPERDPLGGPAHGRAVAALRAPHAAGAAPGGEPGRAAGDRPPHPGAHGAHRVLHAPVPLRAVRRDHLQGGQEEREEGLQGGPGERRRVHQPPRPAEGEDARLKARDLGPARQAQPDRGGKPAGGGGLLAGEAPHADLPVDLRAAKAPRAAAGQRHPDPPEPHAAEEGRGAGVQRAGAERGVRPGLPRVEARGGRAAAAAVRRG